MCHGTPIPLCLAEQKVYNSRMQEEFTTLTAIPLDDTPLGGLVEFAPFILVGSLVVLGLMIVLIIISGVSRVRSHRAVRKSQEDIAAIRELLEKEIKLRSYGRSPQPPRQESTDDTQLPPQP